MAKPIKITPVLTDSEAINFQKKLDKNKDSKVSHARLLEVKNAAQEFRGLIRK